MPEPFCKHWPFFLSSAHISNHLSGGARDKSHLAKNTSKNCCIKNKHYLCAWILFDILFTANKIGSELFIGTRLTWVTSCTTGDHLRPGTSTIKTERQSVQRTILEALAIAAKLFSGTSKIRVWDGDRIKTFHNMHHDLSVDLQIWRYTPRK